MKASSNSYKFEPYSLNDYNKTVRSYHRRTGIKPVNKDFSLIYLGVALQKSHFNLNIGLSGVWEHNGEATIFALCDFVTNQRSGGDIVNCQGEEITLGSLPVLCTKYASWFTVFALPIMTIKDKIPLLAKANFEESFELVVGLNEMIRNHFKGGIVSPERIYG